jgi:hypothetical protein
VYKDVPIEVKKISDINHPCKIGISDAYLFNHKFTNDKRESMFLMHSIHYSFLVPQSLQMKRVIHVGFRKTKQKAHFTNTPKICIAKVSNGKRRF